MPTDTTLPEKPVTTPSSTSITSSSLATSPSLSYSAPNYTPVYPVSTLTPAMSLTQPEQQAQGLSSQITDLNNQAVGESAYRTQKENELGIQGLTQSQRDLTSRLTALKNEALAIPLQLQQDSEGRGRTVGGLQPLQTGALRNNAIQALSTNSLLEATNGNLTTAMAMADRAVAQRFDPIKEQIAAATKNLDLILKSPEYSMADKNRAQQQKDLQDAKARQIAKQEDDNKTAHAMAAAAITNYQNSPAAQMAAQHALALDPTSPDYLQQVYQLLGPYQNDPVAGAQAEATLAKTLTDANKPQTYSLSEGESVYDANGKLIAHNNKTYAPKSTTGGDTGDGTTADPSVDYYAQLLKEGKISLANVPQKIRNQVVSASQGDVNSKLSDTALSKINETDFAISSLQDLKTKIEGHTDQLGPIKGFAALNPWSSTRQLQADVDRVRQTVGKALEGGVLRKEDEEKYKKILATLNDTPENAIYKIDQLISSIQGNIEDFKGLQSQNGRYVAGSPTTPADALRSKYNY